jgi:hypothetical protein
MPNNAGDTDAISSHLDGAYLHIVPTEGYFDGVDDATVIDIVTSDYVIILPDDYNTAFQSLFVICHNGIYSELVKYRLIDLRRMAQAIHWGFTDVVYNESVETHQVFMSTDLPVITGYSSYLTGYLSTDANSFGGQCIATNTSNLYVGCVNQGLIFRTPILNFSTSEVWQENAYGGKIYAIAADDTYVYAGGDTEQVVSKYLAADLSDVDDSVDLGGTISCIRLSGTNLAVSVLTAKKVYILDSSTMDVLLTSDTLSSDPNTLTCDATHVYVGCANGYVYKLLLSDLSTVLNIESYAGSILACANAGSYLYIGGETIKKVYKLLKSTLELITMSDEMSTAICGMTVGDSIEV